MWIRCFSPRGLVIFCVLVTFMTAAHSESWEGDGGNKSEEDDDQAQTRAAVDDDFDDCIGGCGDNGKKLVSVGTRIFDDMEFGHDHVYNPDPLGNDVSDYVAGTLAKSIAVGRELLTSINLNPSMAPCFGSWMIHRETKPAALYIDFEEFVNLNQANQQLPQGEQGNYIPPGVKTPDETVLMGKLWTSTILRDNMVTVFGYLLNHPEHRLPSDLYSSLYLIYNHIKVRRITTIEFLRVLKLVAYNQVEDQFLLIFTELKKEIPPFVTSAVDVWIEALKNKEVDISSTLRPNGGAPVVDFLTSIYTVDLQNIERPLYFDQQTPHSAFPEVERTMGTLFAKIFAALSTGSLNFTQQLFAVILLHLPADDVIPQKDETERYLVDVLRMDGVKSWKIIIAHVNPADLANPYTFVLSVLCSISSLAKDESIRAVAAYLIPYIQHPSPHFASQYYNILSIAIGRPSINVLILLKTINLQEYPAYVVDMRNRLEYYIQTRQIDMEFVIRGFIRYEYTKPVDVLIAILTRILHRLPKLSNEIFSTVRCLQLHMIFKSMLCNLTPALPKNFVNPSVLVDAFKCPGLPTNIILQAEKVSTIQTKFPIDLSIVMNGFPVEKCSCPRQCFVSLIEYAIQQNIFPKNHKTYIPILQLLVLLNKDGTPNFQSPRPSILFLLQELGGNVATDRPIIGRPIRPNIPQQIPHQQPGWEDHTQFNFPAYPLAPINAADQIYYIMQNPTQIGPDISFLFVIENGLPKIVISPVTGKPITVPATESLNLFMPPFITVDQHRPIGNQPDHSTYTIQEITNTPGYIKLIQPGQTIILKIPGFPDIPELEKIKQKLPFPPQGHHSEVWTKRPPYQKPVTQGQGQTRPKPTPHYTVTRRPNDVKPPPIISPMPPMAGNQFTFPTWEPFKPMEFPQIPFFPIDKPPSFPPLKPDHPNPPIGQEIPEQIPTNPNFSFPFPPGVEFPVIIPKEEDKPAVSIQELNILLPNIIFHKEKNPATYIFMAPLRVVLEMPNLPSILGELPKPQNFPTRGLQIRALLIAILRCKQFQQNSELHKVVDLYLHWLHIQSVSRFTLVPVLVPFFELVNVPFPSLDVVMFHQPADILDLSLLLPPSKPGSKEDLRLQPIRMFLVHTQLYEILGPKFNPSKYKTKGQLLIAILEKAVTVKLVQQDYDLFLTIQAFLVHWHSTPNIEKAKIEINFPILLDALPLPNDHTEAEMLRIVQTFILKSELKEILGENFPLYAYQTRGMLLKHILSKAVSLQQVQVNQELFNALNYYFNKVCLNGYGAQTVEYVLVTTSMVQRTVDLNDVFRVIDRKKLSDDVKKKLQTVMKFFNKKFSPEEHMHGFDMMKFSTKGEWLKAFFQFLLTVKTVPATVKECITVLIPTIKLTGVGKEAVDFKDY